MGSHVLLAVGRRPIIDDLGQPKVGWRCWAVRRFGLAPDRAGFARSLWREGYGCITVTVYPATSMVAERKPPVFAGTTIWAGPLPVTLAPEVIVIHGAVVLAVHEHKGADAVTNT